MLTLHDAFLDWERQPPVDLFGDPIWRLPAYRLSLFLSDIGRSDAAILTQRGAPTHIHCQLERALDSIPANISEGYGRLHGKERARYYEIALGSAREAREWYRRAQVWLGADDSLQRAMLLTRVIKILTAAIPQERAGSSERRLRLAFNARAAREEQQEREGHDEMERRSSRPPAPAPAPASSTSPSKQH